MTAKIAFVTGATKGIGEVIAKELAQEGYHLAINGRNEAKLQECARQITAMYGVRCIPVAGDIGDAQFVKEAFLKIEKELGTVALLVNNAGISYIGILNEMEPEEWNRVINTNLTSVFLCCKYAVPGMVSQKRGKIINISSVWGNQGASCEVAYSASKGGVNAFTKALGKELAPSNIQVNAIACGIIDTEMNDCFSPEERAELEAEVPCGRYGSPKEVAEMVVMLAKAPDYLTGQVITMDGGWS